ncbi:hypothetical protein JCM9279_000014 [Rhodotorula babjevae]
MVSSKDERTSASPRTLPFGPAASNSRLGRPLPPTTASAKPMSRSSSAPNHGRTRSFLTNLLERSSSTKRLSEPPSRRQPPPPEVRNSTTPATSSKDAGLRAPGAYKKRLSAPADFKGKASVSLPLNLSPHLSPVGDPRHSPTMSSSRSSRSSPYLTSKPLPLDGDEKMRLASWDFADAVTSSPHGLDKGKSRAIDDADDYEDDEVERPAAPAPTWSGLPSLDEETLSDFGGPRSQSMPVLAGTSRLSIASDTSSTIAWAGPSLTSPPLVRPPLVSTDTFASRYSGPYQLTPILESDTGSDCHHGAVITSSTSHPSSRAHEPTAPARPILHIDPPRRPTRMHSDMSMSIYSRQSIAVPEREHDDAQGGALDWGEELLSYFSPDTPDVPLRLGPLEGLAIRGADTMPPVPTPMSLEGEVIFDPLPTPSVPSQIVLSARPSFSAFAFPSTSSLATTSSTSSGQASHAASPLFDEVRASTAFSTFTVATSVGDGQDGASTPEKDAQGVDGGMWRADWGWEPYRRSAEPAPVVEQGNSLAAAVDELALSPRVAQQPLSSAPASPKGRTSSASPPTFTVNLAAARSSSTSSRAVSPVFLPLAARALLKREKSLPSIPDNASMWSGAIPSGETMHVEVFCTRELVRCGKYGERRVVVERTLLFTEDA